MTITLSIPPVPADWACHTTTSAPGKHAALLDPVAPTPEVIGPVVRNLIAHYRADAERLPASSRGDVDLRRIEAMLAVDQERHPGRPLAAERGIATRLQGCCRDHTLLAVSILRHRGVPARSRVGLADYLVPAWHIGHVVAELHDGERWRRFDAGLDPRTGPLPDPTDLETGPGAGFTTAAEAYRALRAGTLDPSTCGTGPGSPLRGEHFVQSGIFWEIAHRYGDETLLWDVWGAMTPPDEPMGEELLGVLDEVAEQLVTADEGDLEAERSLFERYVRDDRLHPGGAVLCISPVGDGPVRVALGDEA
ncbi:transglutaminase domain-containing protein [Brachybacterium fresconis]|uniref:Transglutaminase-like domain-containing protein n=1 Tax=Brachybacterium fresconis TaxID=173363 RepID=A0ABS4YFZ8_9MICO|nr:transglutaminase domain-containing protein [Brachybacterium fresconis]MBP2407435.1 hypothetical protein [Brachybacterium fresconis]